MTCPTGNCRRTDEHDARGCVVAVETGGAAFWERRRTLQPAREFRREFIGEWIDPEPRNPTEHPGPAAYFMPPRFKP